MKPKISYHKKWDTEGTMYNQSIRITVPQFEFLCNEIKKEIQSNYKNKNKYVYTSGYEMFLKPLQLENNRICFTNHTQTRFINLFLNLKLKDRNTYLILDSNEI